MRKLILWSVLLNVLAAFAANAAAPRYERYSSYWTTLNGFQSSIKLHNHNIRGSVHIQPTLFLANGTPVQLAEIKLGPLENSEIDVSEELRSRNLPEGSGSALFRYSGPAQNILAAETLVTNRRFSLSYTIPSYEDRHASGVQRYVFSSRPRMPTSMYRFKIPLANRLPFGRRYS